ncbi:cAMP-binding domain of CRP or a regulatory subunit of cAMP-dependent protein kinases [Cupriavidus sp. YR651]|uniref:Crp/Fnr family transcriptional regulator n=1 Tax=Cupriavidus sp. YR651 TaxID=1855315 RepID=UPI0008883D76|nr:Crp/Fnr family transcriptional regulator [Cupriavidus sp. YR651]SDD71915.1 cAMP-binding domain of CRP or a regulatory subunit of cAMP-dependent protein kinases [Cupriavidus sp. YR651]
MPGVAEARRHGGEALLSPELEAALRANVMRRQLARNEVLFTYGSSPEALFCVARGRIRFSVTAANGREAVLSVLEPGQWFGEVSLFMDAPRVYDARAVVDCEVLVVPAQAFHAIVDHRPAFLMEFTQLICSRYRWALEWIDETILQPLPVRLARRLLAAQHAHALSEAADGDAALHLSQEDLGHMLGVSRQSINRQLKAWEAQGILRLDYGSVTLLDQDALRRLA